jgi:hypothetical protein
MPESQELPKNPTGRPSDYSVALADAICARIIEGESLRTICADDDMPSKGTVMVWLKRHESFQTIYAHAHELQAETLREQILEIADDTSGDTEYGESGPKPNSEWISRSKLRVDARFKLMALLAPKKYGTKLVDLTSKGDKLTGVQLVDFDGSPVSDVR